jgi:hypothetical protein
VEPCSHVAMAPPGEYIAKMKVGKDSAEVPFTVLADPNYKASQAEYEAQLPFCARHKPSLMK